MSLNSGLPFLTSKNSSFLFLPVFMKCPQKDELEFILHIDQDF